MILQHGSPTLLLPCSGICSSTSLHTEEEGLSGCLWSARPPLSHHLPLPPRCALCSHLTAAGLPLRPQHTPAPSLSPVICLSALPPSPSLCSTVTFSLAPLLITLLKIPNRNPKFLKVLTLLCLVFFHSTLITFSETVHSLLLQLDYLLLVSSSLPATRMRAPTQARIFNCSAHGCPPTCQEQSLAHGGWALTEVLLSELNWQVQESGCKILLMDQHLRSKHLLSFNPRNSHMT